MCANFEKSRLSLRYFSGCQGGRMGGRADSGVEWIIMLSSGWVLSLAIETKFSKKSLLNTKYLNRYQIVNLAGNPSKENGI